MAKCIFLVAVSPVFVFFLLGKMPPLMPDFPVESHADNLAR